MRISFVSILVSLSGYFIRTKILTAAAACDRLDKKFSVFGCQFAGLTHIFAFTCVCAQSVCSNAFGFVFSCLFQSIRVFLHSFSHRVAIAINFPIIPFQFVCDTIVHREACAQTHNNKQQVSKHSKRSVFKSKSTQRPIPLSVQLHEKNSRAKAKQTDTNMRTHTHTVSCISWTNGWNEGTRERANERTNESENELIIKEEQCLLKIRNYLHRRLFVVCSWSVCFSCC